MNDKLFVLRYVGVSSALIFDVTHRGVWNTAQALSLLVMHMLGDVPAATIVGAIADRMSILTAFLLLPNPMLLAGAFFLTLLRWMPKRHLQPISSSSYQ